MNVKLNVLFLLNTTKMGGGNISFLNLVRELRGKGVEICIAYPDKALDESFLYRTKDFVKEYHHVHIHSQVRSAPGKGSKSSIIKNILSWCYYKTLLRNILLRIEIVELKKIIRTQKIDIVHTNVGVIHGGFFATKELGLPHVWHIREYQTRDFGWDILPSKKRFESYLKQSNVITITEELKDYFNLQECQNAKCIYNGCFSKNDVFFEYPKQKYFLCCSRISPEKGIDEAIKAFSLFYHLDSKNKEYRLIIAGFGDENYINELKELARSCEVDSAMEFMGFQEDVRPLMDYATALIVASRFEGFGRMTAEAAFRGCLVIGRDTGGTREILKKTGGFFYVGDHTELAEKMIQVSNLSENDYSAMARSAQKVATELFSNEHSAEAVFSLYQSITGEFSKDDYRYGAEAQ